MGNPFNKLFTNRSEIPALETTASRAEGGDAQAQFSLGIKFAHDGAAQDFAQAAQWYLKAADQNHALAQYNLSVMYFRGQGVPRDKAASLVWIGKAAQLGDAGAQYEFGIRQHRMSLDEVPGITSDARIEEIGRAHV